MQAYEAYALKSCAGKAAESSLNILELAYFYHSKNVLLKQRGI